MRGSSRRNGSNGDRACARMAAEVTTRRPPSEPGVPTVHSSATDAKPLRMKSRRDHASAGGRQIRSRRSRYPRSVSRFVARLERFPPASRARISTV